MADSMNGPTAVPGSGGRGGTGNRRIRKESHPWPEGTTSWGRTHDVAEAIANPIIVLPSLLPRSDGPFLIYPTLVNALVAPSWFGKSMVGEHACAVEMLAGRHVLYSDFESSLRVHLERFALMGVPEAVLREFFHYVTPDTPLLGTKGQGATKELTTALERCSFGVLDAKGAMLVNEGGTLIDAEPTIAALNHLSAIAERSGAGLLVLDHPPGDGQGKKEGFGSTFNKNAMRGVVMHLDMTIMPRPGTKGVGALYVSKDREARVIEHGLPQPDRRFLMAEVTIDGTKGLTISLDPPSDTGQPQGAVQEVHEAVTEREAKGRPYVSGDEIAKDLGRRKTDVLEALKWLTAQGLVAKTDGAYRAFKAEDDAERPVYDGADT